MVPLYMAYLRNFETILFNQGNLKRRLWQPWILLCCTLVVASVCGKKQKCLNNGKMEPERTHSPDVHFNYYCFRDFKNKNKQDGQRPTAYFPSSSFAKDTLRKDESFFQKILSSANFDILKNFLISAKNSQFRVNNILWNSILLYSICNKFATFNDFGKKIRLFFKKPNFLSKKTQKSFCKVVKNAF